MSRSAALLGPEGPLSGVLDRYEARPGQLQMAGAVEAALRDDCVLFCEAGTGTGKTLAYLIPALTSGKRVVVSTATRALQDQLVWKDVPLAERVLGRPVRSVVMKGLGNYLCLRRYTEFRSSAESLKPSMSMKLTALEAWRSDTETGDLSELLGIPEGDAVLEHVRSSSDTRLGPQCAHHADCFVTKLRAEAESAQLIITNHHLFFADLALRGPHPGRVLPNYDAVIFDEAHQLEDTATLFFGVRVSRRGLQHLMSECRRHLPLDTGVLQAESRAAQFFEALATLAPGGEGRLRLDPDSWHGAPEQRYLELDDALLAVESALQLVADAPDTHGHQIALGAEALQRRVRAQRDALNTVVEGAPGRVTWLDNEPRSPSLSSTAVDLSDTLRERVFNGISSVVLTSATLSTSQTATAEGAATQFAFARARLGAFDCEPEVRELIVPSPFDFPNCALLYTPKHLPEPSDASFAEAATAEISELVRASGGGAFVLTTSLRAMHELHKRLSQVGLGTPLLVQGQAPKAELLSRFARAGNAVLVATLSFWEGVDVPGSALRLVILEKVPFSVPSDPVLQARAQALSEEGKNPFNELFLPLAQMMLKQGFGRLIRTQHDRGVVALLDSRIHKRGYGARLLSQLPNARRSVTLTEACRFLQSVRPALDGPRDLSP
jgi:ATP-dependent DNA helicase DinG